MTFPAFFCRLLQLLPGDDIIKSACFRSRKENLELGIPVAEEKWAEVLAM